MKQCEINTAPHKYPPGKSGNPNGRPKGTKNLTSILEAILNQEISAKDIEGNKIRMPAKAVIMTKLVEEAKKGSLGHINTIYERVEGKVVQPVQDLTPVDNTVDEAILGKYEMTVRKKKTKQEVVDDE